MRIFTNIKQFDPSRASFKTWAVRITVNVCIKTEKQETKHLSKGLDDVNEPVQNPEIFSQLDLAFITEKIKCFMPRAHFEVFNMHIVDGFSFEEIANDLKVSQDLVRQRLSRARKWIKENLEIDRKTTFTKTTKNL